MTATDELASGAGSLSAEVVETHPSTGPSCLPTCPSPDATTEPADVEATDQELRQRYGHVRPAGLSNATWAAVIRAFLASGMEPNRFNVVAGARLYRLWSGAARNARVRGRPIPPLDMHRISELGTSELLWTTALPVGPTMVDPMANPLRAEVQAPEPKDKRPRASKAREAGDDGAARPPRRPAARATKEPTSEPAPKPAPKPAPRKLRPVECFGAGERTRNLIFTDAAGDWVWQPEDTEAVVRWIEGKAREEVEREDRWIFKSEESFKFQITSSERMWRSRLDHNFPAEDCVPTADMPSILATAWDIAAYRYLIRDRSRLR